MWPTTVTYVCLTLGALALASVGRRWYIAGTSALVELPSIFIVCMWFGFHLSPLLFILSGEWDSFLLVEEYLDRALVYTTGAMLVFPCGYYWHAKRRPLEPLNTQNPNSVSHDITLRLVVIFSVAYLVLVGLRTEGLGNLWNDTRYRADLRDIGGITHVGDVLIGPVGIVLTVFSAYGLLTVSRSRHVLLHSAICAVGLITGSLDSLYDFSREAGLGIFVLAVLSVKLQTRRCHATVPVYLMFVLLLMTVSMNERGRNPCGVRNFFIATGRVVAESLVPSREKTFAIALYNPIDFMAPWTTRAYYGSGHDGEDWLSRCATYAIWTSPIPSPILPVECPVVSLTRILGTEDICGINTPATAESYTLLGRFGFFLWAFLGIAYRDIEHRASGLPGIVRVAIFLFLCASFPLAMHNGLRAGLRPVWYCVFTILVLSVIRWGSSRNIHPSKPRYVRRGERQFLMGLQNVEAKM